MLEYKITANSLEGGTGYAVANHSEIAFDASAGRDDILPNPAELLLVSLASCMLKNVQRYSEILKIPYRSAKVTIHGKRMDNPPVITDIEYILEVDTDADEQKIHNWHKNIVKFGTITNTLAKSCTLNGKMIKTNF